MGKKVVQVGGVSVRALGLRVANPPTQRERRTADDLPALQIAVLE